MMDSDKKVTISAIIAAVSFAIGLIGLVADIPQVSNTAVGPIILGVIFTGTLVYLAYFLYTMLLQRILDMNRQLNELRATIVDFTVENRGQRITDEIDLDLINLFDATYRVVHMPIEVIAVHPLPNNAVEITIDKGHVQGFRDGMRCRVFSADQMEPLGECICTPAHDRTTLVLAIHAQSPIAAPNISQGNLEVRLIEPSDCRLNRIFAKILYELDGCTRGRTPAR